MSDIKYAQEQNNNIQQHSQKERGEDDIPTPITGTNSFVQTEVPLFDATLDYFKVVS